MSVSGLRVLRGPDWRGGDTDGGEGHVGTVLELLGNQRVRVLWDMGQESTCSAGHDGKCELRVLDTAQIGVRHPDTDCSGCGETDICGMLWRCRDCTGCDLCPLCYGDDKHDLRHQFLRIDTPGTEGEPVSKRKTSVKNRSLGLFPGSKVTRGKDWQWGDQDGGQGSEGEVKGYENSPPDAVRCLVKVQWPSGDVNTYRHGFYGYVDVRCVEEEVGPYYYRDHLPALDRDQLRKLSAAVDTVSRHSDSPPQTPTPTSPTPSPTTSATPSPTTTSVLPPQTATVAADDTAEVDVPLHSLCCDSGGNSATEQAARCSTHSSDGFSQPPHSGEQRHRHREETPSDRTEEESSRSTTHVDDGRETRDFHAGDRVRLRQNPEELKALNSRLGWKEGMEMAAGRVGRVVKVDGEGDLLVSFGRHHFLFSPACCAHVASGTPVDSLEKERTDGGGHIKRDDSGCTTSGVEEGSKALFDKLRQAVISEKSESERDSLPSHLSHLFSADPSLLLSAARDGDHETVRQICTSNASLMEFELGRMTPLILACSQGHHQVVRVLLQCGADVNHCIAPNIVSPVRAAIDGLHEEVVEMLLEHGASPFFLDKDDHTYMHIAAWYNLPRAIQGLAARGLDVNALDSVHDTALHIAILQHHHQAEEALLSIPGIDLSIPNCNGFHLMHHACSKGNSRAVELMLQKDTSQAHVVLNGATPLHTSAQDDYDDCIRLLVLLGGADVNTKDTRSFYTPLHQACIRSAYRAAEALMELGADIQAQDSNGRTPLHLTIGGRRSKEHEGPEAEQESQLRVSLACLLVSNGALVDAVDMAGRDPFGYGLSVIKRGVSAFMDQNPHLVRRKGGSPVSLFAVSDVAPVEGRGQLTEALKGVGLPCGLCGAPKSDVTLLPCQHKCVCSACSVKVTECPLCEEEVKDKDFTGPDAEPFNPADFMPK